ncbi:UDP-N-acetylmuramate dehydrogenase [Patescibacteria group bacterium]|nr:UDP-N-acetylmuramate dehydrogenase [Patescibacteria group bacterium]MBU1501115.1 UDP-N-acetylmuramate dehydrogenase [Patescibacteria group bacterium]MBU2081012.1 UDP-N-acetylmuramate dehydrogenase [Patescibacteria group bacterium]MBU2124104.1 UDP-N-acetylmuramate dehydrogenase [Patescibacteria group bacterium]MBU2194959.1 UDP-N-acetylmuramate dehydrogenase [Patescibacteria group bacterium]
MILRENILLKDLTTLRAGGAARYVVECTDEASVREAVAFAKEKDLPFAVLGQGSNVLASDEGFPGVVLLMNIQGIETKVEGDKVTLVSGSGVSWDSLVREAAQKNLWGIENLAGIPGTVGAAPVQNIGAYGMEIKETLAWVEVLNTKTGNIEYIQNADCGFGYRDSRFKHEPWLVILRAAFTLSVKGEPRIGYADLARCKDEGVDLSSPLAIGEAVRTVRSKKFPDLAVEGTAGSFFKNPIVSHEKHAELAQRYGAVPSFPVEGGIKIPLAFILDRVLGLRGHSEGKVSLFGNQPLVLVAHDSASAKEIDAFAHSIAKKVFVETGIDIEREVRHFPA